MMESFKTDAQFDAAFKALKDYWAALLSKYTLSSGMSGLTVR